MRTVLAQVVGWHLELFWPDDPDAYPHWAARYPTGSATAICKNVARSGGYHNNESWWECEMGFDNLKSVLFVPGIRPAMFEKAKSAPASAICLDLEDSVATGDKTKARTLVAGAVKTLSGDIANLLVRVNAADTGLLEEDLAAVVMPGLAGISLPKADGPEDVKRASYYLDLLEKTRGIAPGTVKLMVWIESASGIRKCEEIVRASNRVIAASFGAEDFTNDMGVVRTRESAVIAQARFAVAIACRAGGVIALDTPDPEFRELEWLAEDSRRSRDLGFQGRFCIHPAQLPVVNASYAPTADEVEKARKIIEVYDEAEAKGLGAVGLDGVMIDAPIVKRARSVVARADA